MNEVKHENIMETFAQKIAQKEDAGIYNDTFLDDIANNTPNSSMFDHVRKKSKKLRHQVINLNNYERYWENSTPTGHQIRIVNQDNTTLLYRMKKNSQI